MRSAICRPFSLNTASVGCNGYRPGAFVRPIGQMSQVFRQQLQAARRGLWQLARKAVAAYPSTRKENIKYDSVTSSETSTPMG